MDKSICSNCKLRVGDYCFCGDDPEKIIDIITECDYFFDDSNSTYYEFIDGYSHCNKLKNNKIKELKRPQGEWIKFADFVAKNVVNEDFSEAVDFYAEVLCRKLVKLGLVKLEGNTYTYCGADMRDKNHEKL